MKHNIYANKATKEIDLEKAQRCLGWLPLKVVEKPIRATTHLAHNYLRLPMRRHFKSRFPQLNINRLREKYTTDTWFSTVPSLGGSTAVQFFVGTTSHFMQAYGMRDKSEGVGALELFIRETGAPYHITNDNSKMQTSKA